MKNAFLNGELEKKVYIELPLGFERIHVDEKVCKFKRYLHGLEQFPRAWFDKFTKAIRNYGCIQSQANHTMILKQIVGGKIAILIMYVDDIILIVNNLEELPRPIKVLAKEFEIKDLGPLEYFLGMKIARSKDCICVSQREYTIDLLKKLVF